MPSVYQNDDFENELAEFFAQTSTDRSTCDLRAKDLVGGDVIPVPIQGVCSYTVYAGYKKSTIVQFRLKSLSLPLATVQLALHVYGSRVPKVRFEGQIGTEEDNKEALYVYVMPRVPGIGYLDFKLAQKHHENSPEAHAHRMTLIIDAARFFALSWKSPQKLDQGQVDALQRTYQNDLKTLRHSLPERFHTVINNCLEALPSIMILPKVLSHDDFGENNLIVHPESCSLVGVIDWAEATVRPFGTELAVVHRIMAKRQRNGWSRYDDYDSLNEAFWTTLLDGVGGWNESFYQAVRSAMALGLLRLHGFTPRLANMTPPVPISDDQMGAYRMHSLDYFLLNPETKLI